MSDSYAWLYEKIDKQKKHIAELKRKYRMQKTVNTDMSESYDKRIIGLQTQIDRLQDVDIPSYQQSMKELATGIQEQETIIDEIRQYAVSIFNSHRDVAKKIIRIVKLKDLEPGE